MDGEGGRDRVSGVGSLLRACRLRAGVTLVDAAEFLNIRRSYLHAIEEERYGDLPGPPYAVGFVRGYAEYLGLDGQEIVRRFRAEMAGPTGASARAARGWRKAAQSGGKQVADLHFPLAASETATPSGSVLLVGAMLALFAYGGWYALTASDGLVPDLVPPLPERLAALLPDAVLSRQDSPPDKGVADPGGQPVEPPLEAPVEPAVEPQAGGSLVAGGQQPSPAAGASAANTPVAHGADVPPTNADAGDVAVTAVDARGPAPADASQARAPATDAGAGDAMVAAERPRVSLEAAEESWVEIRDRENKRILSRLLAPGDVVDVPDQAGLRLTVGNAGGLVIRIDGDPVPRLGRSGVVLRNVPLESASLQQAIISAN